MVTNTGKKAGPALQAPETHRLQSVEMAMVFFPSARRRIKKPAQSDPFRNFFGQLGVLAMGRAGPYTPRPLVDDST